MAKAIFITGCQSGIGLATARYFCEKGWNVAATMLCPEQDKDLRELQGVEVLRLDVEDRSTISVAVNAAIARFGKLDVLVNNAGFGVLGVFEAATDEQIKRQFNVNLFGAWDVTRALLPHFRANRDGLIINISSSAACFSWPLLSLYSATKSAMEGCSEALFYELEPFNIGVKIIEPHKIATSFGGNVAFASAAAAGLDDYVAYETHILDTMTQWGAEDLQEPMQNVAKLIYEAATDGTKQFRYLIGEELVDLATLKNAVTDVEFMNAIRAKFNYQSK